MPTNRTNKTKRTIAALAAAGAALALSACGSTKVVSLTKTVVENHTTTVTATAAAATSTTTVTATGTTTGTGTGTTSASATGTAAATTPPKPGNVPVLNGAYHVQGGGVFDVNLYQENNGRDGLVNSDTKWTFMHGACKGDRCQVVLRRSLSDSTIEDLILRSDRPNGVFTGTIPGGDGNASCDNGPDVPVKLDMAVREGGLKEIKGRVTATHLAGHIYADYQCRGSSPTRDSAPYKGVLGNVDTPID